jgi:hypothetical protein
VIDGKRRQIQDQSIVVAWEVVVRRRSPLPSSLIVSALARICNLVAHVVSILAKPEFGPFGVDLESKIQTTNTEQVSNVNETDNGSFLSRPIIYGEEGADTDNGLFPLKTCRLLRTRGQTTMIKFSSRLVTIARLRLYIVAGAYKDSVIARATTATTKRCRRCWSIMVSS